MTGVISNIQRYSIHDGPGIRTTVFLKGCQLSCWWCQNPETRSREADVVVIESRCMRCGGCLAVCNAGCDKVACVRCGACVAACPTGARRWTAREYQVGETLAEILKDRIFFEDSGGGATFSGGEPLDQPDFLLALLRACQEEGIPTAVDTSGYAPTDRLLAVAEHTDLFLYDLKLADDAEHVQYTGVSNRIIHENLKRLGESHENIWIRVPIIPGVNDDPAGLDRLAAIAASARGVRRVDLLPYHEHGLEKFQRLGVAYPLGHLDSPSGDRMDELAERFRSAGLVTGTRG